MKGYTIRIMIIRINQIIDWSNHYSSSGSLLIRQLLSTYMDLPVILRGVLVRSIRQINIALAVGVRILPEHIFYLSAYSVSTP